MSVTNSTCIGHSPCPEFCGKQTVRYILTLQDLNIYHDIRVWTLVWHSCPARSMQPHGRLEQIQDNFTGSMHRANVLASQPPGQILHQLYNNNEPVTYIHDSATNPLRLLPFRIPANKIAASLNQRLTLERTKRPTSTVSLVVLCHKRKYACHDSTSKAHKARG